METNQKSYEQSLKYIDNKPQIQVTAKNIPQTNQSKQDACLQYVFKYAQKGNPQSVINFIDQYCSKYWMMNLGPVKGKIIIDHLKIYKPKTIIQIGGYCGYSALTLASNTDNDTMIYTIQVQKRYIQISKRIIQFAGLGNRVRYFLGTVQQNKQKIINLKQIDFLFIDHWKDLYLGDFKLMESYNVLKKGSVIIADNIIYPGSPDYLNFFKNNSNYRSILYHSYLQYSHKPDAVLVSLKI